MAPDNELVLQREQLSHQIAYQIGQQIAGMEPGSALPPQGEYVHRLGVSRPVVREAFKLLEARGLISMQQGRPAVVRALDHSLLTYFFDLSAARGGKSVTQLLELRSIIEVGIVQLAAQRATPEQLEALHATLDQMDQRRGDTAGVIDADISFHVLLAKSTGNDMLASISMAMREQMRESQIITREGARLRGDLNLEALSAHRSIYDAVAAHDPVRAAEEMRKHLETTAKDFHVAHPDGEAPASGSETGE